MGLESATWITELQPANPTSTDLRSQGDDHLRLIKTVLQDCFPTASKAWYNPTTQSKSADFSVVAADMNKTFFVDPTAGVVSMTMPTLAAGDAGWECFMVKTGNSTNPVLLKPPSGGIISGNASASSARRCIPNIRISIIWTGTAWMASRACSVPVGSIIPLQFGTLPIGYEWPNGQTLGSASTNYPEFYALNGSSGVTFDMRGRVAVTLDNLGGASAGRLAGGAITGTGLGNTGGSDTRTLVNANLPAYTPAGSIVSTTVCSQGGNATLQFPDQGGGKVAVGGSSSGGSFQQPMNFSTTSAFTGSAQGGTSTAVLTLQPSIMVAQVLVVE